MKDSIFLLIMGVFFWILPLYMLFANIESELFWFVEIMSFITGCFCIYASIKLRKMGD